MASFQMESARGSPVQGVQYGDQNVQSNYFAPVTQNLFGANFERLRDVCFEPAVLERDLDLAHFTGREWLIRQIDKFIATRRRGYVIIQAEAGVGKSSLAAHLVWTRPWLHHFTRLPGGRPQKSGGATNSPMETGRICTRGDSAVVGGPSGLVRSPSAFSSAAA
jgi:hypothetical protein